MSTDYHGHKSDKLSDSLEFIYITIKSNSVGIYAHRERYEYIMIISYTTLCTTSTYKWWLSLQPLIAKSNEKKYPKCYHFYYPWENLLCNLFSTPPTKKTIPSNKSNCPIFMTHWNDHQKAIKTHVIVAMILLPR